MAITKSYGFDQTTATEITGFEPFLLEATDIVIKEDEPNRSVVEVKNSGYDRPEQFTFGCTAISNVYKGTNLTADLKPSTTGGVQILAKYTGYLTVEDSVDTSFEKLIPISIHTVMQVPVNQFVTADDVLVYLRRQMGSLFKNVSATSSRIDELIRGALPLR